MGNLWTRTAPPANHVIPPAFTDGHVYDLAIVGAGFTGCAAALAAAERGASVVALDAQHVGYGGSGRNVGLVNAGLWMPPSEVEARLGKAAGERLNTALEKAPQRVFELIDRHAIACEPVRSGTLHLAHAPSAMAGLEARASQRKARGAPVQLLSAEEARERTGSRAVWGALHDAGAGTIQPLAYCRGLAKAARGAGAHIAEDTPVRSLVHERGRWRLDTHAAVIEAGALLIATNAYHTTLPSGQRTVPMSYFQAATAPLSDNVRATILPGREGCWDTAKVMSSLRVDAAGRLIVGAIGALSGAGRAAHLAFAERYAARHFPQLGTSRFVDAWDGRIALTGDHLPRIERVGPRGYAVYGYNGRGIGPGTIFGAALADACLLGNEDGLPLTPTSAGRRELFARSRALAIEAGAIAAHVAAARGRGRRE